MGERKSGKTTLTYFLTCVKSNYFLDDDCLYILNRKYYGFNMPISIREPYILPSALSFNMVCRTMDDDETYRTLIKAQNQLDHFDNIDYIIFPKFERNASDEILKIPESILFKKIINNVRSDKDMYTTYKDVYNLIHNVKGAYSIKYSSSESAYRTLLSIMF